VLRGVALRQLGVLNDSEVYISLRKQDLPTLPDPAGL
jgi:hypothetical protein